ALEGSCGAVGLQLDVVGAQLGDPIAVVPEDLELNSAEEGTGVVLLDDLEGPAVGDVHRSRSDEVLERRGEGVRRTALEVEAAEREARGAEDRRQIHRRFAEGPRVEASRGKTIGLARRDRGGVDGARRGS